MKQLLFAAAVAGMLTSGASATLVVFDDFNVNEGRFNQDPNFSGSSLNDDASSTADRVTTNGPFEGAGHQQLVLNWIDNADSGTNITIRHLSGSGTPANNLSFTTSAGTDGWIGFFLKTTQPGWTAQLWLEGAENNGGVPKSVLADGQWHAYEWNLDDETGGPNGWGSVAGIVGGDADVQNGSYTIDSILLRNGTTPSSTIFLDTVARNTTGTLSSAFVAVPEASSFAAVGFVGLLSAAVVWFRKHQQRA